MTVPSGSTLTLTSGSALNLGCTGLEVQGSLSVGSGGISQAAGIVIDAGGVLDGGQGTIELDGDWINSGSFIPGTGTVVMSDVCGNSPIHISGSTLFNNLTFDSTTGTTFVIPAGFNMTVNGTFTLQGTSAAPIQLASSSSQTAYISLGAGAQLLSSYLYDPPNVIIGSPAAPEPVPGLHGVGLLLLTLLLGLAAALPGRPIPSPSVRQGRRFASHGETNHE